MMMNKQRGPAWAEGVTNDELKGEITRRQAVAVAEVEAFKLQQWPTHRRAHWYFIANMILAMFGTGLSSVYITRFTRDLFGDYASTVELLFAACVFLVFLLPAIWMTRKEQRIWDEFKGTHPEHAKALRL